MYAVLIVKVVVYLNFTVVMAHRMQFYLVENCGVEVQRISLCLPTFSFLGKEIRFLNFILLITSFSYKHSRKLDWCPSSLYEYSSRP
jgi:hypothetical protein